MKTRFVLSRVTCLICLLVGSTAWAEPVAELKLPNFDALTQKATEAVNINLNPSLLGLASGFLDQKNPQDAAVKELVEGLRGIYVRSFTFDSDYAYPAADLETVRKQLSGPGWQRLVQVRSKKERANVDIYMSVVAGKANGLAIIAAEPREFTIVNIVGSVDLEKLHKLEGQFGIPKLEIEKTPTESANK
jgi:uncharacterized protein DUF4252